MSEFSKSREQLFKCKTPAWYGFSPEYGDESDKGCTTPTHCYHGVVVRGDDGIDYLKVYLKSMSKFGKVHSTFGYIPITLQDGTVVLEKIEDEQKMIWMENDILRIEKEITEARAKEEAARAKEEAARQEKQLKEDKIQQFVAGLTPEQQVLVQGVRTGTRATFSDLCHQGKYFRWENWEALPRCHTDNYLKLLELLAAPKPCAALPGMEEALADGTLSVHLNNGTYYHDGLYCYFDSDCVETNEDCWENIDEIRIGSYSVDLQTDSVIINWCRIVRGSLPHRAGSRFDFETTIVPLADFR